MTITSHGRIDALKQSGKLFVPLTIIKQSTCEYIGFIPGILMSNITAKTEQECLTILKNFMHQKLKAMMQNKEPFPFFPDKKEIYEDYKNVCRVELVKIFTNKQECK